jgi:hypothetical protein
VETDGNETRLQLDKAWRSTCKAVFGQEIGALSDYSEWLSEYVPKPRVEESHLSRKPVTLAENDYCQSARFSRFDEVDFFRKFPSLSINEIKDIDSLAQAVAERALYTGYIILGSSRFVENSSSVIDSHFISDSAIVSDSKYISHSNSIRKCEHMFGVLGDTGSSFTIRGLDGHHGSRLFETYTVLLSSDCYYSVRCDNCQDCFFCFGLRSKSHAIGNLALPKEKYISLKAKLLSEIAGKLKKDRKIFSLLEIIEKASDYETEIKVKPAASSDKPDKTVIEDAFSKTTSLLLGKQLTGIDSYAKFLRKHVPPTGVFKSQISGENAYLMCYLAGLTKKYDIGKRFATINDMHEIGKHSIESGEIEKVEMDSALLAKILHPIAYLDMDDVIGDSKNIIECCGVGYTESCYRVDGAVYSKKCAYSFWPRESEYIFGSYGTWVSSFAVHSYHSKKLSRCYECDICESCSDTYFAHNCENLQDSMFCFNVKNLRNAIGNAQMPPDVYKKAKDALLSQIASELEKKKDYRLDIFNVGCGKN